MADAAGKAPAAAAVGEGEATSVRAAKAAAAAAANKSKDGPTASEKQARCIMMSLLGLLAAAAVTSLLLAAFPDEAPKIALTDKAALGRVFGGDGGAPPHFVLCESDASNAFIARVFGTARAHLRGHGVETVIVDCEGAWRRRHRVGERRAANRARHFITPFLSSSPQAHYPHLDARCCPSSAWAARGRCGFWRRAANHLCASDPTLRLARRCPTP